MILPSIGLCLRTQKRRSELIYKVYTTYSRQYLMIMVIKASISSSKTIKDTNI